MEPEFPPFFNSLNSHSHTALNSESSSLSETEGDMATEVTFSTKVSLIGMTCSDHNRRTFENVKLFQDKLEYEAQQPQKNIKQLDFSKLKKSDQDEHPKSHKKNLKRGATTSGENQIPEKLTKSIKFPFTQRELIQPISSRGSLSHIKINGSRNLNNLDSIDEKKEAKFDNKIYNKVKEYVKDHPELFPEIPTVLTLEESANQFFDREINNKKKTNSGIDLRNEKSGNLIRTERPRAENALRELQKSAILIKEITSNLKHLQDSVFEILTGKKKAYKSKWSNRLFNSLTHLIESHTSRNQEMNPLKTFTYIFDEEVKDKRMKELISSCLKLENKDLENLMDCLRKWADFTIMLPTLADRVATLDRKNIKEDLNLNPRHITNQKHEWFESLDAKFPLSTITVKEILRCLMPGSKILYSKINVNGETIVLDKSEKEDISLQIEFFTLLLSGIYWGGFDLNMSEKLIQNQALCLVDSEKIAKEIRKHLEEDCIPWGRIESLLMLYPAIPFIRFKETFNATLHLEHLDDFLTSLAVPCLNVLKLCTNSCWLRGDECIRYLFEGLFVPYGKQVENGNFHTVSEHGIECHIKIKNQKEYSVTQIKKYGTYPLLPSLTSSSASLTCDRSAHYARITFKWTTSPHCDSVTETERWKGVLEIPHVETGEKTPTEIKTKILSLLNNPVIVDYVANSIRGEPMIISTFKK